MGPRNNDDDEVNQERHEQVVQRLDSLREADQEVVREIRFLRSDLMDLLVGRTPKEYVPIETYHATIRALIWAFGLLLFFALGLKEFGLLKSLLAP